MRGPLWHFLDAEEVEWLHAHVGGGIARQGRGQIDLDELRASGTVGEDFIPRELGVGAVGIVGKSAARANQVGHGHVGLERILSGHLDPPIDSNDPCRLGHIALRDQLVHHRPDDPIAPGGQIEHCDAVARHEHDIVLRARRFERGRQVGRQHAEMPVRRRLTANQQVVNVRAGLQLIDRVNDVREADPLPIGERPLGEYMPLHENSRVECLA